ncbi:DUF3189 family protein [Alkaliphilus serpentinus]|uniref:DUF3189 family protein n=1 Tax=Alkaliphilus serpentinus TaxID=1482731 RepID=A0A833HQL3_9FIRM|nr:DUF3189 family protein [Alkaliphilus serpentinus]KAB3531832.1 DUF3189 family protein [Alkaliphilus serpentinus]
MYIIFYGTGKSLTAAVSAYLYLKNNSISLQTLTLPMDEIITLINCDKRALGGLVYMDKDQYNNKIYILNTGPHETIMLPALSSVFDILEVDRDQLYLVDTTKLDNLLSSMALTLIHYNPLQAFSLWLFMKKLKKRTGDLVRLLRKTDAIAKNKLS